MPSPTLARNLNEDVDVLDALRYMTGGQGPDACIDAVGLEEHDTTIDAWQDRAKTSMYLATDRPHALRQAINACRRGGHMPTLLERIDRGEIDPSFIIPSHRSRGGP